MGVALRAFGQVVASQVLAGLTALAFCVAAQAQVDPVFEPLDEGMQSRPSSTLRRAELGRTIFISLIDVPNPASLASSLTQIIRYTGNTCVNVTDFQVIYRQGDEQRLKIKCPGRPLYAMFVTRGGNIQTVGGDGLVGDFNAQDGIIYAVSSGVTLPELRRDDQSPRRGPNLGPAGNLPGSMQGDDTDQLPAWLVTMIIVNAFIISALLLSFFWFMRVKTMPAKAEPKKHDNSISSAEKDTLIIESREVLPQIYRHPDGRFIARGRRGKRRMFGNLFFAILYRDYGFKVREII